MYPPGFQTRVGFDFGRTLGPKGFFLAVVFLMGDFTRRPWDSIVQQEGVMEIGGVAVVIKPAAPSRLRFSHASLGLNAAAVTAVQGPLFYRCLTNLSLYGTDIGSVEILPSAFVTVDDHATDYGSESNLTTNHLGESGTIIDPGDTRLKITYDLNGRKINSKDMFTAVLVGLTILAQYDERQRCSTLQAFGPPSHTGQAVISMREVPTSHGLICCYVTRALLTIFEDLNVGQNKFGEMDFDVFWDGEKIATGDVLQLDPPFGGGQQRGQY